MNEHQPQDSSVPGTSAGCISCGNPVIVKGFPNALCEACREGYIKHPIPKWIKIFAAAIGLIFLVSVYKIPKNISIGIHFEKGKTAISEKKYLTAQKELKKVVAKVPQNLEARSNLMIAAFYNEDFDTFSKLYNELAGQNYEDMELYGRVEAVVKQAAEYFPTDSFMALQHRYHDDRSQIPDDVLTHYTNAHVTEAYPLTELANRFYLNDQYVAADSVLSKLLSIYPDYLAGLGMMAGVKRGENKTSESIVYCDKVLAINPESVYALSSKSRTLLKQKKDKEALSLAASSYQMDDQNYYTISSLALAYHFNGNINKRDEFLKRMSLLKDSASVQSLRYVKDVMSGKENFRN